MKPYLITQFVLSNIGSLVRFFSLFSTGSDLSVVDYRKPDESDCRTGRKSQFPDIFSVHDPSYFLCCSRRCWISTFGVSE